MSSHARLSIAAAVFVCAGWAGAAEAGNLPAAACRPMAHLPGELWLGHFSGGRKMTPYFVDWRDDYACFTSRAECRAWRAGLGRAYAHVEGWGTCVPLRGGGKVIVAKAIVVKPKRVVVRARY